MRAYYLQTIVSQQKQLQYKKLRPEQGKPKYLKENKINEISGTSGTSGSRYLYTKTHLPNL